VTAGLPAAPDPLTAPVVARVGAGRDDRPLVVLLHGRGADESSMVALAESLESALPGRAEYAAVRAPLAEGAGFAWFANRGIGRPLPESLRSTMDWFRTWADQAGERPVVLVGFSGGAAFAGGLALDDPARWAGLAALLGTLPFDAGVPTEAGRLEGLPVLVAQGEQDRVIPAELLARTWEYLRGASDARTTSHRDAGGHLLTAGTVRALVGWLDEVLGQDVDGSRGATSAAPAGS
jgi:phospholipase/carboxylesterase